jgi:hypothetical protein
MQKPEKPNRARPSGRRLGPEAAAVVGLAAALAGCERAAPMQPEPPAAVALSLAGADRSPEVAAVGGALDDASSRLVPSLKAFVAKSRLDGHLRDLSARLAQGDEAGVRRALSLARKALTESAGADEAPDLAAIELALDRVEALLRQDQPTAQP